MSDEPFPFIPNEVRPRGEFPEHSDEPQPRRTALEARLLARVRLLEWRLGDG